MKDLTPIVRALDGGAAVIIPTDTVYGLAARPDLPGAVDAIFRLKRRDQTRALPVLGTDMEMLSTVAMFDGRAELFAHRFWPGPLTLVLPRAEGFTHDLGEESHTVAVRVPDRKLTLELLRLTGPLAVTSANLSGEEPASDPEAARAIFGPDVQLLEDGPAEGEPSTVVSLLDDVEVLREGAIPAAHLL